MIPLRDVIPSRTFPFITIIIIVLNAMAWVLELSFEPRELEQFLYAYGVVPGENIAVKTAAFRDRATKAFGARNYDLVTAHVDGALVGFAFGYSLRAAPDR